MEFHEKLQELRKSRGLTQEELANALYVSRTAVSKWESGKGYPSIDSLKEISKYFSVTIDDLLSSEELMTAARDENRASLGNLLDLLLGITDIMSILLMLLPLYPEKAAGSITSVSLFAYTGPSQPAGYVCWGLLTALVGIGVTKAVMNERKIEKGRRTVTGISFVLSIIAVLFLTAGRLPYAAAVAFLLLVIKGILLLRSPNRGG